MKKSIEKLLSWTTLCLIFLIIAYFALPFFRTNEDYDDNTIIGNSIYDLIKAEAIKSTIKQTKGKALLLFFFTTSCPSCFEDVGYWFKLTNEYQDKGLTLIGVTDSDISTIESFLKQTGTDFGVIHDESHSWEKIQIKVLPTVLLLDKNGKIIYKQPINSNAEMEQIIVKRHIDSLVE